MLKISCAIFTGGDEGLAREKCRSGGDFARLVWEDPLAHTPAEE
jgi:hypothetical protein